MRIRNVETGDSKKLLQLMMQLDNETKYMLYEPGERKGNAEKLAEKLAYTIENKDLFLVIEDNDKLVGYISAAKGIQNRIKHSAYIVVGILKDYRGIGFGTKLFQYLDKWAVANKVKRLELTVMRENSAAIHLYKKMGFEIEGIKKNSCIVDGKYMDEFYMSKIME